MMPHAKRTWIVMMHGQTATVLESLGPGCVLTRVDELPRPSDKGSDTLWIRSMAARLDQGRRAGSFERLMIVAPPQPLSELLANLSEPTLALLAATSAEDLSTVPMEEMRLHVPQGAWL